MADEEPSRPPLPTKRPRRTVGNLEDIMREADLVGAKMGMAVPRQTQPFNPLTETAATLPAKAPQIVQPGPPSELNSTASHRLTVLLPPELIFKLKMKSASTGRSLSSLCREWLEKFV